MISELSVKQETIVDAALKRFSHFGIDKTTLSEIAGDLKISKPLLFYYFNDKLCLVLAVIEKLLNDFIDRLTENIQSCESAEDAFYCYLAEKQNSLKQYMHLALQLSDIEMKRYSPKLLKAVSIAQANISDLLAIKFSAGIKNGELKPMNSEKTIKLLLETMRSFEYCLKMRNPFPEKQDIDELFLKQKKVAGLVFNGIKKTPSNNITQ